MISRDGERMVVSGPVTLKNVSELLEEGLTHVRAGASSVDLGGVSELDSSLIAVILAWIREAQRSNRSLTLANLPKGLETLAQLYGVEQLLPVTSHG
jgi:phospholipid transport system transporter-binding protein